MGNFFSNSLAPFDSEAALLNDTTHKYSFEYAEAVPGMSAVMRNTEAKDGLVTHIDINDVRINTISDILDAGASYSNGEADCYGTRQYFAATEDEKAQYASKASVSGSRSRAYVATGYRERHDGSVSRGDYIWHSYNDMRKYSHAVGRALISKKCTAIDDDLHASPNVGVFSVNRSEWFMTAFGLFSQSLRAVPLYPTLGPDAILHTIIHAELQTVVVSIQNFKALSKVFEQCTAAGYLKHVIILDSILDGVYGNTLDVVTQDMRDACEKYDIELHSFSDILNHGLTEEITNSIPLRPAGNDDLAFIMYTSGTTGSPKGVMLSHNGFITPIGGMLKNVSPSTYNMENPTFLSFLPLSHCFEWSSFLYSMCFGCKIGVSQGDVRYLAEDIKTLRPHILPGVPKIFSRFYQGVWAEVEKKNSLLKWYVMRAYNYQIEQIRAGLEPDETYDSRIFAGIRNTIGLDRIRIMVSGGAPTPPYLFEFMFVLTGGKASFGIGYGMTESSSGISVSNDRLTGHAGANLACCDVALLDVEEMGYKSTDKPHPRGEIIACGTNTFKGYYKDEKATEEATFICSNGREWLRTGDIGRLNPNGSISVIDRKKNLIKLAQGEYVALERIEDTYSKAPIVSQIWCYGNAYKSQMVGIVVPNWKPIYDYAVENNTWPENGPKPSAGSLSDEFINDFKQYVSDHMDEIIAMIKEQFVIIEKELLGFEKLKVFTVLADIDPLGLAFTEENQTLTPTMKKKRKNLVDTHLETLKEMYAKVGEPAKEGEHF